MIINITFVKVLLIATMKPSYMATWRLYALKINSTRLYLNRNYDCNCDYGHSGFAYRT